MKPSSNNPRLPVNATNKLVFGSMKIEKKHFVKCSYADCSLKLINKSGAINPDTIVTYLSVNGNAVYYCRDCVPKIMKDLRKELDDTLWAFK